MWTANLVPGQGFRTFYVYEETTGISPTGRPTSGKLKKTNIELLGQLVSASQKEIDQWKQEGHPITHKIVEYSAMAKASATNYLELPDGRQFYVQGVRNPGELNVTMIYYVEERLDVRKE